MTKRVLAFLVAAIAALALPALAAAEPNQSATLDASTSVFKWSSGPVVGVAPTSEIDQAYPCGSPGHFCDDTLLNLPLGGDLAVKIAPTSEAAIDLDLYLLESNAAGEPGKLLRSSVAFQSEEQVAAPKLKAGYYLVRVNSSVSAGGTYDGEATLKNAGAPAVTPPGAPDAGANAAPTAAIKKLGKTVKAKRLKGFSGTAADDKGVSKVEIAVVRGSASPRFAAAKGTAKWTYKLRKKLRKGSYTLVVRVTDTDGATALVKQAFKVK